MQYLTIFCVLDFQELDLSPQNPLILDRLRIVGLLYFLLDICLEVHIKMYSNIIYEISKQNSNFLQRCNKVQQSIISDLPIAIAQAIALSTRVRNIFLRTDFFVAMQLFDNVDICHRQRWLGALTPLLRGGRLLPLLSSATT